MKALEPTTETNKCLSTSNGESVWDSSTDHRTYKSRNRSQHFKVLIHPTSSSDCSMPRITADATAQILPARLADLESVGDFDKMSEVADMMSKRKHQLNCRSEYRKARAVDFQALAIIRKSLRSDDSLISDFSFRLDVYDKLIDLGYDYISLCDRCIRGYKDVLRQAVSTRDLALVDRAQSVYFSFCSQSEPLEQSLHALYKSLMESPSFSENVRLQCARIGMDGDRRWNELVSTCDNEWLEMLDLKDEKIWKEAAEECIGDIERMRANPS